MLGAHDPQRTFVILLTTVHTALVNAILEFNTGFLPVQHQWEISFFTESPFFSHTDLKHPDPKHAPSHTNAHRRQCIDVARFHLRALVCFSTLAFFISERLQRVFLPVRATFTRNNRTPANCCHCPEAHGKKKKSVSVRNINGAGEESKRKRELKRNRLFLQKILMKSGNRKREWAGRDQYRVMTPV